MGLTPDALSLGVGATGTLACQPMNTAGEPLARNCNYRSRDASVATVTGNGTRTGTVTGIKAGSAWIVANAEQQWDSTRVNVGTQTPPPGPEAPVATALVFAGQPSNTQTGGTITPAVTVEVRDRSGARLAGASNSVSLALGPGSLAGTLTGGTAVVAVDGVATFSGLSIDKPGTGYTLAATSGTLTGATSTAFSITAVPEPPPPAGPFPVLVAAGDIASCSSTGDAATANLVDGIPGTVLTLGDNVYSYGSASEYANCYEPTWGRHKPRTRPSPGNHDYSTAGASAYYAYFGNSAGPAGRGYYSFDLGDWHIVSLNSNVSMAAGSAQETWLRADLAASTKKCTLAYWHHPRFSSGTRHGNFTASQPVWRALYQAGADVVLSAHEHNYERFAPQTAAGVADAANGIREFVVGTGGRSHYSGYVLKPNSEVLNRSAWGVIKLTLKAASYSWQFIPVPGQSFTDSGTGQCH